jgi:hypothetical protein
LEELLSAYLDGELSAAERARAEELLLDDPQARQLLQQFRGIGGQVRQLPKHSLPADFASQVLKRAERQMLANEAASTQVVAKPLADTANAQPALPWSERVRRPLIYSILAASVAFLLTRLDPKSPPPYDAVAKRDSASSKSAATAEPLREDLALAPEGAGITPPGPSISAPGASSAPLATGAPASTPAMPALQLPAYGEKMAQQPAALANERSAPMPTSGLPLADSASIGLQNRAGAMAKGGGAASFKNAVDAAAMATSVDAQHNEQGLLVVECVVAPEALKNEVFQKVLARQQVEWSYAAVDGDKQLSLADQRQSGREKAKSGESEPPVKLLYVEATPQQLEKTLAELAAQPENFPGVAVDPVANFGRQQRWQTQYNRRSQLYSGYYNYGQSAQQAPLAEMESTRSAAADAPRSKISAAETKPAASNPADKPDVSKQPGEPARPSAAKKFADETKANDVARSADAKKQAPPESATVENFQLNNLSRARSYSVPRELNRNASAGEQLRKEVTPEKPVAAGAPVEQAIQPAADRQLPSGGGETNVNRIRALFVLQSAEPAASDNAAPADPAPKPTPP